MSHWDFGRPADAQHDAPPRSGSAGAAYPSDLPDGTGDDVRPAFDAWAADEGPPARDGWPAGAGRAAPDGWDAHEGWPPAGGWPGTADASAAGERAADDGWDDDEDTVYPLTYERDDFAVPSSPPAGPLPAAPAPGPWEPRPPGPRQDEFSDGYASVPPAGDREDRAGGGHWSEPAGRGQQGTPAAAGWTDPELGLPGDDRAGWAYGGRRRGARRWLLPAGVIAAGAAVGAAAVMLTSGHPGAGGNQAGGSVAPAAERSAAGTAPGTGTATTPASGAGTTPAGTASAQPATAPVTLAEAKGVLAGYTTANNNANAQRSDTQLAAAETGSSFAIDAGLYVTQAAAGTAPYPAFGPVQATYYIPGNEPAGGPRWFVVQVANAFNSAPGKVTSNEYLLFTQSAAGTWQDTIEPYLLSGAGNPQIQTGTDGLATAVSPDTATLKVTPSQLPADTAASLDGTAAAARIASPGNLADQAAQTLYQGKDTGGTVTDTHTPAAGTDGQQYALQTADGGALVFYTDAAHLTITPPAGSALHLAIPGLYTSQQSLTQAAVAYLEQFAAYDPPATAAATPRITADYSGITGKN